MAEPKKPWPMIEYAGENNPVTLYYLKKPSTNLVETNVYIRCKNKKLTRKSYESLSALL